jgi:hypothetical protein
VLIDWFPCLDISHYVALNRPSTKS